MPYRLRTARKIDIIFCVDNTCGMSPYVTAFRSNQEKLYEDFVAQVATEFHSDVEEINVKIITFGNYTEDGDRTIVQSGWYSITVGDDVEYEKYLKNVPANGGEAKPKNGLEALFYAMTSDWNANGRYDRQIIVLLTEADAVPLGTYTGHPNYPAHMVDTEGFLCTWMGICPPFMNRDEFKLKDRNKRLLLFAPAGTVYESFTTEYNRCLHFPLQPNDEGKNVDFNWITTILLASAGCT